MNTMMHEVRSDLGCGVSLRIGIGDRACVFSVIWVNCELAGVFVVIVVSPPSFGMIEFSIACTNS